MAESKGIIELLTMMNPKSSGDFKTMAVSAASQNKGAKCIVTGISREDVLSALVGLRSFETAFVFAFVNPNDQQMILGDFSDLAYRVGFDQRNHFRSMSFETELGRRDLFPPLWLAAWCGYCGKGGKISDRWLANRICVGRSKAKAIRPIVDDAIALLHSSEADVASHLRRNLYEQ